MTFKGSPDESNGRFSESQHIDHLGNWESPARVVPYFWGELETEGLLGEDRKSGQSAPSLGELQPGSESGCPAQADIGLERANRTAPPRQPGARADGGRTDRPSAGSRQGGRYSAAPIGPQALDGKEHARVSLLERVFPVDSDWMPASRALELIVVLFRDGVPLDSS